MSQNSADWATCESIIRASYDSISGKAGEPRDLERLKSLYAPGARMIPIEQFGDAPQAPNFMSMDEYIASRSPFFSVESFYEWETDRLEQHEGCMAHVWSNYEAGRTLHGDPIRRGVNSVQLWHDGERWWIMSMTWDAVAAKKSVGL